MYVDIDRILEYYLIKTTEEYIKNNNLNFIYTK